MKTFIVGILIGAALYGVGNALLHREVSPRAKIAPPATELLPEPPVTERSSEPSASDGAVASAARPVAARLDPAADNRRPAGGSRDCVLVDDKNLDKVINELSERRLKAVQASLDAEPRDPLWSDSMEQQLRSFIERQPGMNLFAIKTVDCRTLYCTIAVEGPPTVPDGGSGDLRRSFDNALVEVEKQLGLKRGMSGGRSGGGAATVLNARLPRFGPDDQCPAGFQRDCWNR